MADAISDNLGTRIGYGLGGSTCTDYPPTRSPESSVLQPSDQPPPRRSTHKRGPSRSSVTYRRFPALAEFSDADLDAITMSQNLSDMISASVAAGRSSTAAEGAVHGQTVPEVVPFSALSSFRASVMVKGGHPAGLSRRRPNMQPEQRASATVARSASAPTPFRPVNPRESRDTITELRHGFVTMRSPYDAALVAERKQKADSRAARVAGAFVPSSAAHAKRAIQVGYYLNSPDSETMEAERAWVRSRAEKGLDLYTRDARSKLLLLREREKKADRELLAMSRDL